MPDISFPSNPSPNDTYSFGGKTWIWTGSYWALNSAGSINGIPIGNVTPSTGAFTTLSSTGNTTLGNIVGNVLPAANVTYSLGSTSARWQDLWIANSSIYMGDVVLATTGNALTINGANVMTGNAGAAFSTTGNVTGGNLNTAGAVSATGNVTGGNLLLNGGSGFTIALTPDTLASNTTITLPNSTTTMAGTTTSQTLTNKRIDPRVSATTSSAAAVTPDVSQYDMYAWSAQAATLTINAPIGTPTNGTKLTFRILDDGTPRTISWDSTFTAIGVTLPTTTVANKTVYVGAIYNTANTRWDVVGVALQA